MKRTPLKRKPPKRRGASEKQRAAAWWDEVMASTKGRCAVNPDVYASDCHHVIEKRALKARDLHDYLWDPRNGMPLSSRVHSRHTTAVERIRREFVPAAAEEFAAELGLTYLLDRYYGGAVA